MPVKNRDAATENLGVVVRGANVRT